jgi:ubiquinone biosynthesis protein
VALSVRFAHILISGAGALLRLGWRVSSAEHLTPALVEQWAGHSLAGLLERLGATFVKFGQILSSRPDLLGPSFISSLSRLQDNVPPIPYEVVDQVLQAELGAGGMEKLARVERAPLAAASVAQVHRATLVSGEVVAIKVQRPLAAVQIERDLALLRLIARALDWVPSLRMLSLPGAVERFADAMWAQLDFRREAENNARFAHNFRDVPDVAVPRLLPQLCTSRVLTMEFIEGVKATEPERVGGDRQKLARVGMDAILRMVFEHGFVHADLHPGNIFLTPDSRIVLIDLGLVAEIDAELLKPYVETFLALAQQDGATAARLFYTYAPQVNTQDYAAFEAEIVAHFRTLAGKTLGEVETSEVLGGIMNVLRRHRVQMDPAFTVVHLALIVAEGLGKQLDNSIDPVQMSVPYLLRTLAKAPKGKQPLRTIPGAQSRGQREA